MEGVHLSLIPELGNKVRRAFIEGVHLERVHLERVDCNCNLSAREEVLRT